MKLPIVDSLKTVRRDRVAFPCRFAKVSIDYENEDTAAFRNGVTITTSALFSIDQKVADYEIGRMDSFHDRAAKAISHEIYGPVIERLIHMRYSCWERGDEESSKDIDSLINDLSV